MNRRHVLPRPRAAAIPPIRCGTRAIDEACSVIMVCAAPAAARRALAGCLTAAHGGGGRSRSSRAAQRSTSSIFAADSRHLGDVSSRRYRRPWASAASRRGSPSGAGALSHRTGEIGPRSSATNATRARGSARALWRFRERQLEGN